MADPPTGPPEPLPTRNTRRSAAIDAGENSEPRDAPRTRRQTRLEEDNSHVTWTTTEPESAVTSSGRVTTKEIRQIIEQLQHTIDKQSVLIQATRNELREVKHSQSELQTQNETLREEIQALRTQVESLKTPPSGRSWAAVAADVNNSDPHENSRHRKKEKNCVRISTRQTSTDALESEDNENTFGRYLPTTEANTHIRNALSNDPSTQDVQVAGVGTTRTGYIIRFKDSESAEAARCNTEWLRDLGNETRLVRPRHGVVVHHLPTHGLDLEKDKAGAIKKLTNENDLAARDFRIEDIAWLKKRDKNLGTFASIGIWFDSAEAAEWMVDNGLLIDRRYIGRIERYKAKEGRCFRCQRFGHQAWSCKEKAARCGHCGGPHERSRCPPGVRARCLECSGEHPTGDSLCPTPTGPLAPQC